MCSINACLFLLHTEIQGAWFAYVWVIQCIQITRACAILQSHNNNLLGVPFKSNIDEHIVCEWNGATLFTHTTFTFNNLGWKFLSKYHHKHLSTKLRIWNHVSSTITMKVHEEITDPNDLSLSIFKKISRYKDFQNFTPENQKRSQRKKSNFVSVFKPKPYKKPTMIAYELTS